MIPSPYDSLSWSLTKDPKAKPLDASMALEMEEAPKSTNIVPRITHPLADSSPNIRLPFRILLIATAMNSVLVRDNEPCELVTNWQKPEDMLLAGTAPTWKRHSCEETSLIKARTQDFVRIAVI